MLHCVLNFLFCMIAIVCINLLYGESFHMNKCVETERQALVKFKDAIIHHGRVNFTSWKGEECCKWNGISCDNLTGHVTGLYLQPSWRETVGGKLDSSICELEHLTFLSLDNIGLEGKIPKCIGSLGQLTKLSLSGNKFVSVIPPTLRNLSNLQTLDLSNNIYLMPNDLEWLSYLSNLIYLDLSYVNLTLVGDWLSSISKSPSLSELHLSNCGLHQFTPKSIPHMNTSSINVSSLLTFVDLTYNELQDSIPTSWSLCQLNELHLTSNLLSGRLSDNIQQLCCAKNSLEVLDLSDNSFESGPLPNISCLSSLTTLSLQNTNVVGLLPKSIVHSSFLRDLDLSHNQLHGVDIIDDAYLSNLVNLDLSSNQLSGSMSIFEITKLVSLQVLDLSHNQLSGPFPHTIGQLPGITWLSLSTNKFQGVINEVHLSNLSQLEILHVSENSLSFNLSSEWVPPFKLESLHASFCPLGPKFPPWLKHQGELKNLDISQSGISDSFPKWFWNLSSSLEYLNVSHNKLHGPLPKSFPSTKIYMYEHDDHVWDFSYNNLDGSLPPFPEVGALFLSNNMFMRSLSSFCKSSPHSLIYLDLSSNMLAGKMSDCWGKFERLIVLNLANNNLSGKVPDSIGTLRQIESLHLNNNNFNGEIPSLILCHNLKLIDFGDNKLQGSLPMWIGHHLHQLIVLRMRANKFEGNIPTSMCNLSFLQVLDLSINNITGEIPQCFSNILALSDLMFPRYSFHFQYTLSTAVYTDKWYEVGPFSDKAFLALKGSNREYGKNLALMTTIDLSCNHLTGEIPQSITKLVALVGLNLSGNNLTGLIPNNIGHMKMLESLDLSRNHLTSKMPTSFSNLTFLSYMNLSFNNLEGKIPLSTQLQSFDPSSFVGNARLCGQPLINLCPNDAISPARSHDKDVTAEDEDKLITFGFYVSLGLGSIIGFWGICGTLVIKTSWRQAYFRFFKNMNDRIHVTLAVFVNRMKNRFQAQD